MTLFGFNFLSSANSTDLHLHQKMQTRLELYQKVTPLARLGIWERKLQTGEVFWNEVIRDIYEVSEDFNPVYEITLSFYQDQRQLTEMIDRVIRTAAPETGNFLIRTAKGNYKWVKIRVNACHDQGQCTSTFGTLEDVTDEVNTLRQLDNIIKSTRVGTWEWNIETAFMTCNKRAADILGYDHEAIQGEMLQNWQRLLHPRDMDVFNAQLQICFNREKKYFAAECRMRHDSGKWLWIEIRGKVVQWNGNTPIYMLGTFANIHERKILEEEREQTLGIIREQNNRLLNFAHIVSHNLRSHTGNIQMLLEVLGFEEDEAEKEKLLGMLHTNATNLQETLSHLNDTINISDTGTRYVKIINPLSEIRKVTTVLSQSIHSSGAEISIDADPGLNLNYDPAYFESILLNLISNAIKYRDRSRQLRIRIRCRASGGSYLLEVEDNGLGIDLKKNGHKLFGMYKTFHGNEDARGIGLFLVKNQIDAMGGSIHIDSTPGKGTSFKIHII